MVVEVAVVILPSGETGISTDAGLSAGVPRTKHSTLNPTAHIRSEDGLVALSDVPVTTFVANLQASDAE